MKELSRKWYSEIVLLHCVGMLMILFAHIAHANGFMGIGEILISGVPLFLFVSGFLVGARPCNHNITWIGKKTKRILLPYYLLLFVVFVLHLILQTDQLVAKQWIILFANMQGLKNFLFHNDLTGYYSPLEQGLGHLWFVTIIMICYLLVPIMEKVFEFPFWKRHSIVLILVTVFVLWPVLLFYNVAIGSIMIFFLGFLFAKHGIEVNDKRFVLASLLLVFLFGTRLLARACIDGAIIYNYYIASLSNSVIGLWIVMLFFYLRYRMPNLIDKVASWKAVLWLESIIYEFYLIHHIIIKGSWSFYNFGYNPILTSVVILVVTIGLSLLLKSATNHLVSKVFKK